MNLCPKPETESKMFGFSNTLPTSAYLGDIDV